MWSGTSSVQEMAGLWQIWSSEVIWNLGWHIKTTHYPLWTDLASCPKKPKIKILQHSFLSKQWAWSLISKYSPRHNTSESAHVIQIKILSFHYSFNIEVFVLHIISLLIVTYSAELTNPPFQSYWVCSSVYSIMNKLNRMWEVL